jgi:uncharacterized membrane protein
MTMPEEPGPSDFDIGPGRVWSRGSTEFDRVIFLSDAVIAIALTILVLDLNVPTVDHPQQQLAQAVWDEAPGFLAFGLTFAIIAINWIGHHRFVSGLERIDSRFVQWNFVYLLLICLMPYTSSLISEYADDSSFAVAAYIGLIALLSLHDILGDLLVVRRGLLSQPGTPRWLRYDMVDSAARAAVMAVGIAIAYISSNPSQGLLWLLVLVPVAKFTGRYDPRNAKGSRAQPTPGP